ncbi:MAG: serine hydrolase [Mariniphaga sp.]|jgi:CubicO group peptidase (beta-lactamase class C family)|nr:serine hydrolase [Mariniphaga sp.]
MNFRKSQIPFILLLILIVVAGISCMPKTENAAAFKDPMKEDIEYSFIHMDEYLPIKMVEKAELPFVFPQLGNRALPVDFVHNGTTYNTLQYLDSSYTQGFLFIKNDTIRYENYWRGQEEDIQHISWSMAKSYLSALFGIAMEEGFIKSIDQTVDEYIPELKGSGYEGVKIKDVLQMSSGVKFDETYSDPESDINRYWGGFVSGESQDEFAGTLINETPPGTYNKYVSIDTHVLGMILVKATGRSLTDYLQEKIWKPLGAEFDAYWIADGIGMEMANGGLNACLRDYAKLGRLYLNKGNWNGKQIVPQAWCEASISPTEEHLQPGSKNSSDPGIGYGYQWWIVDGNEGEFMAIGVFNQHIYINPATKTIIVKNSANKGYYDGKNPFASTRTHIELYRKMAHMED